MRAACVPAMLLLAACSFESPDGPGPDDQGDGSGGGGGGGGIDEPGCADDDADTVCNTADKCAGNDDRLDVDTDGAPDGCDDWPCGLKPADPGGTMSDSGSGGREWESSLINIGDNRRVVAAPGAKFSVGFGYRFRVDCPSGSTCKAQLEIGYGLTRIGCGYDSDVGDQQWRYGLLNTDLTAPAVADVYEIRLNAGRNASCGTSTSWYGGDPGTDSTIAILCVR